MTSLKNFVLIGFIAATLFAASTLLVYDIKPVQAAFPNFQSRIATSSTIQVGPQQVKTLFSASDQCSSRIISSVAAPLMISFGAGPDGVSITPSATLGHVQPASSTTAYDSSLFGCGTVTVYAFSSTTITFTETRY